MTMAANKPNAEHVDAHNSHDDHRIQHASKVVNKAADYAPSELKTEQTIDSVHQDEAFRIISEWTGDQNWEPSEEKAIVRRLDRTVLVLLTLTYGLQYYDKAMLSQAALFGLRTDLELTVGDRYSFSASIFYLGFIIGAIPAILLSQRFPIERVCAGIVLVWGVCLMCTAACRDWKDLYVQRFFLGFLESGVSPMFMLIVGGWYKRREQALRMGIWYSATGYVSIFAPLINFGLGHINGSLSRWKYMYLVAGTITIFWSAAIYFFLPADPIRARGLTDRQRYIAVARLRVNNSGVRNTHFKWEQALEVLTDIRFWLAFSIAFLMMIANGPVSTFMPIFISEFGFSQLNSLLLTMPAGACIGTIQLLVPYCAYKFLNIRTWLIVVCQLLTIMSALLLWLLPRDCKGGLLFGCYFLAAFGGGYAVLMGLQVANTAGYTKRSVASSGIFIGYCLGNFVGPLLFKTEDAPGYHPGFIATVITSIVAGLLAIVYRFVCIWENGRRDNKHGAGEGYDNAYEDDLTDMKNPQFRYTI